MIKYFSSSLKIQVFDSKTDQLSIKCHKDLGSDTAIDVCGDDDEDEFDNESFVGSRYIQS